MTLLLPSDHRVHPLHPATGARNEPDALRATASQLGYVFLPGLAPAPIVAAARQLVRDIGVSFGWFLAEPDNPPTVHATPGRALQSRGFDDPEWIELQRLVNESAAFRALGELPGVLKVLAAIYEEPAALAQTNICWVKLPGSPEHTTLPHQDRVYAPGQPDLWTAWFPLVDNPMELGPLAVVPGSNRGEPWPHTVRSAGADPERYRGPQGEDIEWASSPVRAGDVLLFGTNTVHAAWSNVTADRVRLSADLRYLRASSRQVF